MVVILRLQIDKASWFIDKIGFKEVVKITDFIQMITAFQYDLNSFFSLQKIHFTIEIPSDPLLLNKMLQERFHALSVNILDHSDPQWIICILKQKSPEIFPFTEFDDWAFLFPITVIDERIILSIIIQEKKIVSILELINGLGLSYQVLALKKITSFESKSEFVNSLSIFSPNLTKRQQEIVSYAIKKGYFERPRKITSKHLAEHFGISKAAINKHLNTVINESMTFLFGKKH